jgi:hypothetical protein
MGIFSVVNVPTAASKLEMRPIIDGENISIVCSEPGSNDYVAITSTFVGNHMFSRPEDLRRMYANDLIAVIRMARDIGYHQAKADIRAVLEVPAR